MPGSLEVEPEAKPGGATESSKGGSRADRLQWLEVDTILVSTDEEGETSILASGTGPPKTGDPLLFRSADEQLFGSLLTEEQAIALPAPVFALLATLSKLFTLTALLEELAVQIALSLTLLLALPQLTLLLLLTLLEALSILFAFLRALSL